MASTAVESAFHGCARSQFLHSGSHFNPVAGPSAFSFIQAGGRKVHNAGWGRRRRSHPLTNQSVPGTAFLQHCGLSPSSNFLGTPVCIQERKPRISPRRISIEAVIATDREVEVGQTSRSEEFVAAVEGGSELSRQLQRELQQKTAKLQQLQTQIDELYNCTFANVQLEQGAEEEGRKEGEVVAQAGFQGLLQNLFQKPQEVKPEGRVLGEVSEQTWREIGRSNPALMKHLMASVDRQKWQAFQRNIHPLQLTRDRIAKEAKRLEAQVQEAVSASSIVPEVDVGGEEEEIVRNLVEGREARIVLISGFESFNVALYKQAAAQVRESFPGIRVDIFSDRDINAKKKEIEAALAKADVFFGSLLFDYDQCEWLKEKVSNIPVRLCFESSLELMSTTQIGSFTMAGGQKRGMPAPVKAVLSKFGGGREEDKMVGYLSFLKIGPKLLRFLPGKKVRDLRNWLTIYGYWNQGGLENVVSMLLYLTDEYLVKTGLAPVTLKETPALGLYHPDYDGYFESTSAYLSWHRRTNKTLPPGAPTVAVLLYRKHVITNQKYIPRLIRAFESDGLRPLPIFINGVEAHTVVRDLLTTKYEQDRRSRRILDISSLKKDAALVDAVVSTVGFPLVGGPAGTMEGGRQAEIAKQILSAKNVPYVVSAPLLIQDIPSWLRDGVQGLQSVVLYSLPELDGAIDAVPLGGLVGDGIHLVPERVRRLTSRLKKWISLRAKPASERKVAIVLYGFPPGVGATGTAALLNVPRSLEALLGRLRQEGYDLGDGPDDIDGEQLIEVLKQLDDERVLMKGEAGGDDALAYARTRVEGNGGQLQPTTPLVRTVDYRTLKGWIGETLTGRMERTWGELHRYRGIRSDASGASVVSGVQLGNVFIAVQPLLGLEGDPMRLLFERDLTPHPQYAAFYKWLQNDMAADAVIHFGMHGTVEWLPGSPLGNTGSSWSDVLLGALPNVYIYAANNPSESIVAKRRGYGTIVSYNVPPYGRAGLYKELASLRELLHEYREDPVANASLRGSIVGVLSTSGLDSDCPFREATPGSEAVTLGEDDVSTVSDADYNAYVTRLYEYLSVVENRLFSEGLHTLGVPPTVDQMQQYLSAYLGDDLPERAVEAIASTPGGLAEVRVRLEELYREEGVSAVREEYEPKVREALEVRDLLMRNTEEMDSVVKALNGEYILPAVGGDLLRDGPGVLPTGRNIHALDPYRMPSAAAWERGSAVAANIVEQHRSEHGGAYPETVAVMLWGLDAIKTRGESLAIALALIGATPVKEGTGRIVRFELVPLPALGRPRIDVLANLSGIFRDSFANVVELLDDLFRRAAEADEPPEMNYVRKHALELQSQGIENSSARIFSNPAGDYGSMVNERVGTSDWNDGAELGDTWQSRNSFSYGRGEQGVARPEVLRALLASTDRIVQEIDSVEYGLTDIQEYYANTGAMKAAAETLRNGKKTQCSIVESFGKDLTARGLDQTLRLEYRAKLLNPKWAQKMAAQGSGGAFEISQRMTALVGWGGTADFKEDWVYDQAAETYALDAEMAAKLRKANPQAFQNVVRRMLEAAGRGLWNADPATIEKLREIYAEMEDELEGVVKK